MPRFTAEPVPLVGAIGAAGAFLQGVSADAAEALVARARDRR